MQNFKDIPGLEVELPPSTIIKPLAAGILKSLDTLAFSKTDDARADLKTDKTKKSIGEVKE